MTTLIGYYVSAPLKNFTKSDILRIKSHLTSKIRDYMTKEIKEIEYFFIDEKSKRIQVPRFYPLEYDKHEFITNSGDPLSSSKINKKFIFRENQEEDIEKALSSEIITLMKPPGSGKTIIGAAAILKRGVRSLILVDQDQLKDQWVNAINLVFGDNLKINRKSSFDAKEKDLGYDIYISTIQAFVAKIRTKGLSTVRDNYEKYNIGNVLIDECHALIGPEKFSLFGHVCNSRYILALSATPKDDIYFQYWLGTTIVGDKDYKVSPKIIRLDFYPSFGKEIKYITWGNTFRKDRYAKSLYKKIEYLNFICSIAYKSYLKNRHTLVICDYNKLGVDILIEHMKKYIDEDKLGRYVAGCKREETAKKPILFSNYKMLQKGTDIPTLDTLIMSDSVGNKTGLEQVIGRILRLNKGIKKKELLVFDIQDDEFGDLFHRRLKTRLDFYKEKNFTII